MVDTYFIGYDAREHEAAAVAAYSIQRRANTRARIYILEHQTLRKLDLFWREWVTEKNGQMYDQSDGKPFSTGFSHSRFLVFELARELKCTGPCMFVDCDWVFQDDPGNILRAQEVVSGKIGVVNRSSTRKIDDGSIKMDGMLQADYHRKLWSALFTFMPTAALANQFSPDIVNSASGRDLHGFLSRDTDKFWEIDPSWHYIPSLDPYNAEPKGIHFSEFSPWINPARHSDSPKAFEAWRKEHQDWLRYAVDRGDTAPWRNLELDIAAARA